MYFLKPNVLNFLTEFPKKIPVFIFKVSIFILQLNNLTWLTLDVIV